jgi:phage major head subunit gpT-like protein
MGTLNRAALVSATTGYRALYHQGRASMSVLYPDFVMDITSTGSKENYQLSPLGLTLREWTGDRRIKNVKLFDYTLANVDYEGTIQVDRNDFLDDNLGHYRGQFIQLGMETVRHGDSLLASLLSGGFSATGYDGVAFFSNSHLTADGTNDRDNLVTGSLNAAKFEEMVKLLRGMKAYNGKPLNPIAMGRELCLIVPPALEATGKLILEAAQVSDGSVSISNVNYGNAKLVVNPYLSSTTEYYLTVAGGAMAPFIHQKRQSYELVVLDDPNSETLFLKKKILFGVDGREAMGYGHFDMIVGSQG